ncbi:MAG: NAD(P)-dependent glycerol-3-phosphate dehydrogenase [Defluviitaleaceae bacterium]|nr:NAD(P)-dependent glycerol-3-phosphate dehydrogenase [Defluviitaleaceae bacterium]
MSLLGVDLNITMLGFGSWGLPLAILLQKNGHNVTAWDANADYVDEIAKTRKNSSLPDIIIPDSIKITSDVHIAAKDADVFVCTLVSKSLSRYAPLFSEYFTSEKIIVSGSKGLEESSQKRISEYLHSLGKSDVVVLTGPTHAEEVLLGIPTTILAACKNKNTAQAVQGLFSSDTFRVYTSTDVIGAEIGGALKNVIAIAAGSSDGLGFGDNTKAALITRGIAEITRLGVALGADAATFSGLSGIGDLIVTCTSRHSRNWQAGNALAQGLSLQDTLTKVGRVAEGVDTAATALRLAKSVGVEMPIVEEINRVLFEGKSPKAAVSDLMMRELKSES